MVNDLSYLDSAATLSGLYALAGGLTEKVYEASKTYDSFRQIIPKAFSLERLCNSRLIKASKWIGMGTLAYNGLRAIQRLASNSSQDRSADYVLLAGATLGAGAIVASALSVRFAAPLLAVMGTGVDLADLGHAFRNWQNGQVRWHQLAIQAGLTLVFGLNTGKKSATTTSDAPSVVANPPASSPLGTVSTPYPPSPAAQPGGVPHQPAGAWLGETSGITPSPPTGATRDKITIKKLSFFYGGDQALYDITLRIPPNSVTALIGPSGCGKTTLIRALNRLNEEVPDTRCVGEILIDGENILVGDSVLLRRRVGMIFQRPNPFPHLSTSGNAVAGLGINGIPDGMRNGMRNHEFTRFKVKDCLEKVGLWEEVKDRLHLSGASLSGGQQQRLCIARALAIEPEVLLMDEPCSALDPIATACIEELIRELSKRYTIIIVTHNMQQAARVSDWTAFLYLGRLIEYGLTDRIFTNPFERQTADYITGRFG